MVTWKFSERDGNSPLTVKCLIICRPVIRINFIWFFSEELISSDCGNINEASLSFRSGEAWVRAPGCYEHTTPLQLSPILRELSCHRCSSKKNVPASIHLQYRNSTYVPSRPMHEHNHSNHKITSVLVAKFTPKVDILTNNNTRVGN